MYDSLWRKARRLRAKRLARRTRARSHPRLALDPLEPRQLLAVTPQLIQLDTEGDSLPTDFVQVGDFAFFVAATEAQGRELWKTDGTPEGTTLVRDIVPGLDSSNPESLTELNGQLYFSADDGAHGRELWKSDGTDEGTVLVRDLRPGEGYQFPYGDGPYHSNPRELTNVNGTLFFSADDGNSGTELWMTDGTDEGTLLVKDIAPGVTDGYYGSYPNSSSPSQLTNINGTLFFAADDGINGQELWKSDGTQAGTVMVRDINSGAGYQYYYGYGPFPSSPQHLTDVNGKLFFTAVTQENGGEVWMSDGTTSGTMMVRDLSPGTFVTEYGAYPYSSYPRDLIGLDGTLFFTAFNTEQGEELWRTDGTEAGTTLVKDIYPGTADGLYDAGLAVYEGMLFFAADDGDHGTELWRSDGTEAGTVLVSDLSADFASSSPESLTVSGGTLYFTADTSASGRELWKTDGTTAGTVQVDDIYPGTLSSNPDELFDLDAALLFSADDGAAGFHLWTLQAEEEFGALTGTKYEDLNTNGVRDDGEPGLAGLTIFVDANNDGQLNNNELSTVTDQDGQYRLDVPVGTATLRATRTANKIQTFPVIPDYYSVTVAANQEISDLDFGEATLALPATLDLLADSDTGSANDDDVTARNNDSPESSLQFRLTGIANTAEVRLFASDVLVATVTATSSEINVTTDGVTSIPDGVQTITAVQVFQGVESAASAPLNIVIDTQTPTPIDMVPDLSATVGELFSYDVDSDDETSPNTQYSLSGAPDGMTIDQDGVIVWTPSGDQAVPQSFQVLLTDTAGNMTTRELSMTVVVDGSDASANTLAGHVYVDVNDDLARGANERGVPGVLITLSGSTTSGDSMTQTAITNNDGRYRFKDVPSGTYRLTENQPHALTQGSESTPIEQATVSSNQIANITLSGGQLFDDNDFGESQVKAEYLSIAWFFASATSQSEVFRDTVALGEERVGNAELAASIRAGDLALESDLNDGAAADPDELPASGAVTLAAAGDTTLYESQDGTLGNGSGEYLFSGLTGQPADAIRRGLVKFDVASAAIPADATITDASLTLHASKITPFVSNLEDATVNLHRATADWGEGDSDATEEEGKGADSATDDATWLHTFYDTQDWTSEGGDYLTTASAGVDVDEVGFYEWSSTEMVADVQAWLDDPGTNYGWFLIGNEEEASAVRFDTRENPISTNRPVLQIDYLTAEGAEGEAAVDALTAANSPVAESGQQLADLALQQEDNWLV